MISQVSVNLSTGGVYTPRADTPSPKQTLLGRHPLPLDRHPLNRHPRGRPPQVDTSPPETATAVDGAHPTGMHSCY